MTPRLRIGLDFDGVIIDHHQHKLSLLAERCLEFEPWQTNTNVMKSLTNDEPMYRVLQDQLYAQLTTLAPPVRGALEAIATVPADLFIVCARPPANIRFAQEWLGHHRVYDVIPAERIFFCGTSEDKRAYCERLRLHAFMDDKLGMLRGLPTSVRHLLFDEDGVSERLEVAQGIEVVRDWKEFCSLFDAE
jgi:hypothetical protein